MSECSLQVAICGSRDFARRMNAALASPRAKRLTGCTLHSANVAELRSVVLTHRSDIVVLEINREVSAADLPWLRSTLAEIRFRNGKRVYVVLAVTAPERFTIAGGLLFANEYSLEPSGLIDNCIIAPPSSLPATTLEAQFIDCLELVWEVMQQSADHQIQLPALWTSDWVPTMCDPRSRETWMRWLPRYARYVSENPIIVGPTGTGKTRLAAALHRLSRREGPFVSITPRDFSSMELVQAELFGAVQGAYTGAVEKWGLVKRAERGTLFIDELQSIDLELQGKLITFIENKSYRRVGESASHTADVRFVFASNRPLDELVEQGRLRDDFAYRLERLQLILPPLAERRLDIPAGLCYALARIVRERSSTDPHSATAPTPRPVEGLTAEAYARLFSAPWPGNLRQLENTVARMLESADIRGEPLVSQASAEEALASALGNQNATVADVFVESLARAARTVRLEKPQTLAEFSATVQATVREVALEFRGGNAESAGKLLGEDGAIMSLLLERGSIER